MNAIRFTNGSQFEIADGASLGHVIVLLPTIADVENFANEVSAEGALNKVDFLYGASEETLVATGEYEYLTNTNPLFKVEKDETGYRAILSLSQMDDVEVRLAKLEAGQQIQDGAISDLGDVVSEIASV